MRVGLIEGLCLVAAGVAMVELHDSQRAGRFGNPSVAVATPAKPAAVATTVRAQGALDIRSIERER